MPFVRISLLRGKSPEYLAGLQAAAHDALVEAFGMPTDDDFGIIDQYEPHELAFHRTFRISAPRSDDFVMFTITDGVDRGEPAKRRFYKLLVDLLGKRPGVRPQDVFVIIHMETRVNFSFGDGVAGTETAAREALDRSATVAGSRDAWTNEEIIEAIRAMFADNDRSRVLPMLSDDLVLSMPASMPYGGEFTGPKEFDAFYSRVVDGDYWASFVTTPKRIIDAGDQIIAQIGIEATGKTSGTSISVDHAWIFDLAAGRIVRAQIYADTAAGTSAVG
ncbi:MULTISPECIES: tautomerase family protein [Mycobacteriales]|jgi:ketosteroid isomerase-like protein|uniref:Tautomerase family protein n=1 Tax=Rhodococcus baikonurensis TaxID=172041 RepID=A0ABV5XN26_9NOCA|nr:tautomerase family protein [Gordonia polyisoprenivorans]MBE7195804.1 tautomerase family protein [Gordonia polyisoprenivorans]